MNTSSLVDAINDKFQQLNNGAIIGLLSSRASSASFSPSKVLFMDAQGIKCVGDEAKLGEIAGHVEELDLSANFIDSWKEIFILFRALPLLRSLNLSYNPLAVSYSGSDSKHERRPSCNSSISADSAQGGSTIDSPSPLPSPCSSDHMPEWSTDDSMSPISPCKYALSKGLISHATLYPQLETLILNSTSIPWTWVLEILERCPNLAELHLALNSYGECSGHIDHHVFASQQQRFPSLKSLYYSQNGPIAWDTVQAFDKIFPHLSYLVLLGNKLYDIPSVEEQRKTSITANRLEHKPHAILMQLKQLCLNDTLLNRWQAVDNLADWMPHLETLKFGLNLPLFQGLSHADCRNQVIARMPHLQVYNSLVISEYEREQAEREFLRLYANLPSTQRPRQYNLLELKHGTLSPLMDIDLAPKKSVRVRVEFQSKELWHELNVTQSVAEAKKEFASLYGLEGCDLRHLKLYYYDKIMCQVHGPEELRYATRKLHSLQPEEGDLFQLIQHESVNNRSGKKSGKE